MYLNKLGSPPYTWGILQVAPSYFEGFGITPIYMGNTGLSALGDLAGLGSPPYTWGIPYYCLPFLDHTQDHPHIHGEYGGAGGSRGGNPGSPPYTWGIHLKTSNTKASIRITPIYMGNTFNSYCKLSFVKDHPHIHGEYFYCRFHIFDM